MLNLYWLHRIKSSEYLLVGEKAATLSQLLQQNYSVIPGFVLTTSLLKELLVMWGETEPLLADLYNSHLYVNLEKDEALQSVAREICQAILTASIPSEWLDYLVSQAQTWQTPALILRPSISAPNEDGRILPSLWQSQVCLCQAQELELGLKKMWLELFRARSLFYLQKHELNLEKLNLAIVIQPITPAIASGILKADDQNWLIQATWGLGHSMVRGEVSPDIYQVAPDTGKVNQKQLGNKHLAYGLNVAKTLDIPHSTCLQTELISEEKQKQYALDSSNLEQLIALAEQLSTDWGHDFSLEWTLYREAQSSTSTLSITQFKPNTGKLTQQNRAYYAHQPASQLQSPPLIQGISASPGKVIASAYVLVDPHFTPPSIPSGSILVAKSISLHWLPLLKQAAGLITEQGGTTSHGAIIARELAIPAIVGAREATQLIHTGELIHLDGGRGVVFSGANQPNQQITTKTTTMTDVPVQNFPYPLATRLMVNLSQSSSIEEAAALPVDGVGLLRSDVLMGELMASYPVNWWLQTDNKPILQHNLTNLITQFATSFAPRPIFYRSCDWHWGGIEIDSSEVTMNNHSSVSNLLGRRGTFNYRLDPTFWELELAAIAQVYDAGHTNVNLILPFVRSVEEFRFCRRRLEQLGLTDQASFQVWIMAEVPSVLFLMSEYVAAGVQGIAIGSNDLTQLLLGVNREQGEIAGYFDERHPAVLAAMKQLIETAQNHGIPCSICGQAPSQYPEIIDHLVRWGITAISVEKNAVATTYQAIARAEQRLILSAARREGETR